VLVLLFLVVAAVLAGIEVFRSRGRSLLAIAVLIIALVLLIPAFGAV
jgi:hypothetical protein